MSTFDQALKPPPPCPHTQSIFSKTGSLGWVLSQHCKIMFLVVLSRCIVHRVSVCGDVEGWWVGSGGGWTGGRNGGRAGREGERLEAPGSPWVELEVLPLPGGRAAIGLLAIHPPPTNPSIHPSASLRCINQHKVFPDYSQPPCNQTMSIHPATITKSLGLLTNCDARTWSSYTKCDNDLPSLFLKNITSSSPKGDVNSSVDGGSALRTFLKLITQFGIKPIFDMKGQNICPIPSNERLEDRIISF